MNNKIEVYGISKKEKDKSRCGDYYLHIEHGDYVIIAVSNGVGSRPCDWLASKTTCDKFVELSLKCLDIDFSESSLISVCRETDRFVSNAPGHCTGMMATLSAVIWNSKESKIYLINAADSRVYLVDSKGKTMQLSIDDLKPINMRSPDGKLMSTGGSTIIRSGLTNAFGLNSVSINPIMHDFNPGDTLFLVTDGFYNCSASFEEDIAKIASSPCIEQSVNKTITSYSDNQDDDATIAVLRNNTISIDIPADLKQLDFILISNKLAHFQLIEVMNKKLRQCIVERNFNLALDTLSIIESEELFPSVETLNEMLSLMTKPECQHVELMSRIIKIIRLLMKAV